MLPKETLLDIVRTCTVFMDVGKVRAKIVPAISSIGPFARLSTGCERVRRRKIVRA